jgi:hypothetical protein
MTNDFKAFELTDEQLEAVTGGAVPVGGTDHKKPRNRKPHPTLGFDGNGCQLHKPEEHHHLLGQHPTPK